MAITKMSIPNLSVSHFTPLGSQVSFRPCWGLYAAENKFAMPLERMEVSFQRFQH